MNVDFRERNIDPNCTLLEAFKRMDVLDRKLLIVLDDNKFYGLLSAGDIQRAIIHNKNLETLIVDVLRKNVRFARPTDSFETIRQMMFDYRMELCPVVDEKQEILKVYYWEDIFKEEQPRPINQFNLPVVIMAGGLGTRLKPLTNVLPKPLLPIGEKTMLEEIFDRFAKYGCNRFFVSVNYKADLIKYYIGQQNLPYELEYFIEDKPLGTAGSLCLLKGRINETFFVSNCDILIEQDYAEILEYHRSNSNEITVVAALKHYPIPYGTIKTGNNGILQSLTEKPELSFKVNSGMYILEPHLLNEIPSSEFLHITQLIEKVKNRNGNVGVFTVSQGSWKDMGDWNDYLKYFPIDNVLKR